MVEHSMGVAGIDTGKHRLDIAVHGQAAGFSVENRRPGFRQLAAALAKAGVSRVGIEATGGYERDVVAFLRAAGFEVAVLQPMQVKAFAKMRLRRAKNDTLDAALIAACTAAMEAPPAPPDERVTELADALTFVEQIEEDIRRIKTRLEHVAEPRLRRMMAADLQRLQKRRLAELRRIEHALRQHSTLAQRLDLAISVPGIGTRTALALLLHMPELGGISREQAAALAGVAPFANDSGKHRGERHIAGGRTRLRCALFAASLPAAFHWNAQLIAMYRRLIARGKAHKVALVACARKLLIMVNAVLARGTPWQAHEA